MACSLNMPSIDAVDRTKPRSCEPTSPMNILAGLKLYGMKPRHAPTSAARITATFGSATNIATTSIVSELIVDTPTASPSSPSIRLTAFVQPTIQRRVSGMGR